MADFLESIVRPFQAPVRIATQRIPVVTTQVADQTATLSWGSSGSVPQPVAVTNTSGAGFKIQNCNESSTEQSRQTTTQRITNPNDSSQFVDVQIPQAITFQLIKAGDTLNVGFGGESEFFANADEVFSEVAGAVPSLPANDSCNQKFTFT